MINGSTVILLINGLINSIELVQGNKIEFTFPVDLESNGGVRNQ